MKVSLVFAVTIFTTLVARSFCSVLAYKGYLLASPNVRSFVVNTGLGNLLTRKSQSLYEASNFRYAADQGTDIRKAEMNNYEILEIDPKQKQDRKGFLDRSYTKEDDRLYSEKLFRVLNEMDRNGCLSRLLCEIGTDPKAFGFVGLKIHYYIKSVPPVTWNSATFPYLEAFQGGLNNTSRCSEHYTTCNYDLRRVMKYLLLFLKPVNLKTVSGF